MHARRTLGNQGESAVVAMLYQQGFIILARNYTTRTGEVDVVAAKQDVIAFVEVKTRKSVYFPISQTVTWRKQQKIIKAAKHYVLSHNITDKVLRFDVATVLAGNDKNNIEYIENAFAPHMA